MSLSSLLVQREVATIRDVEEALARQVLYGGDLVTNLLESATVDEIKLAEVLGEAMGLRPAGAGTLPEPAAHAKAFVSRELAEARTLVPLDLTDDGEQLIVAVAQPLSIEDDEKLMFQLGMPLVQRIAPLVRVQEALARDYGVSLDRRFDRLLRRLRGEPVESLAPAPRPPKVRAPSVAPTMSTAPETVVNPHAGPVPRTTIAAFPAPQRVETPKHDRLPVAEGAGAAPRSISPERAARPVRRRRGPLTFDAAKRELEHAPDRDSLIDLFFDFSRQYYDYSALFVVHGDLAEGRDAFGAGAPRDAISAVGIPLDLPSVLSVAKERAMPVLATPAEDGIDAMLVRDLGRARTFAKDKKGEVIIVPLVVRRRTVALLYGDSNDGGVPIENPSDVTIFALLVGQAFERLIMKKKFGSSDRALPRVVAPTSSGGEDRAQRALALSRALSDEPAGAGGGAPASEPHAEPSLSPESPGRSPAATSVPPPVDSPPRVTAPGSAPPPGNVLLVRRPSGPPIPREDPDDPTRRPPEQVFVSPTPARASRPPAAPTRPSRPPPQGSMEPVPSTLASPEAPGAFVIPPLTAPVIDAPHVDAGADRRADAVVDATVVPAPPVASVEVSAAPVAAPSAPPRRSAPPLPERARSTKPAALPSPAVPEADEDAPAGDASAPPPARIESEELAPLEARRVLAEIEAAEEIDDDMIEESSPASTIPPSQTIVVAPHRPPTSRTDTENLPTIIVDVSAELEVLVRDVVAGKNEERAEAELLRQGASAMPAILATFPGPTKVTPTGEQESFPSFSGCGPVLRLIASQRKVALPYILPLVPSEDEDKRFWATFALTELAYPEAMPVLVPRLFDASARVRRAARLAVAAVSRVYGEHVARELGRVARDGQAARQKRLEIVQLLEEVREPLAVPTFIALLEDPDRTLAEAALHALCVVARHDLGADVKKWKSWWNAHSSKHRIEWLIEALMHESMPVRKEASEELKAITKEYFGYYPDEARRDREKAQARYKEWWSTEGRLKFV